MRILVTGANGYIGRGVVERLDKQKNTIIATDIKLPRQNEGAVNIETDLFAGDNPYDMLQQPEAMIHLAWRNGFEHNALSHIEELPLHYEFIRKMVQGGVKNVCILGSMHEVGFFEGSIKENTPTNPQSLYGISKNALRQSVELLQKEYDFSLKWIRGFYIVGNTEYGCSVFSKITQAEKRGEKKFPFTSGDNQFDFIDYDIFCRQVIAVCCQDEETGIINCCSGSPVRLRDRVERFIHENHYKIELDYGKFPDRPYDSKAVWGNNEKILKIMSKL